MHLSLTGVTKSFTGHRVLREIDLEMEAGETVAVVGPSGSGKSTVLQVAGGLLSPDEGSATIRTDDGRQDGPRHHVAFVLQTVSLLTFRSAQDNVALGGLQQGLAWKEARARARMALNALNLSDRLHARAATLSGGEAQRVAVARATISGASFILADEPTGQLDADTTREVMEAMQTVRDTAGLLLVTHDLQVAASCDRTLVLDDGRLRPA